MNNKNQTFKCLQCNRIFATKKTLVDHSRTHTGERPFVCQSCQKSFIQQSSLQKHKRIHTGERPYVCNDDTCEASFNQISNLNRHNLIHLNLKQFTCPTCQKTFTTSFNLNQHVSTHEKQRQIYICQTDGCQKTYLYIYSLKKHMKHHKNKEIKIDNLDLQLIRENSFEIFDPSFFIYNSNLNDQMTEPMMTSDTLKKFFTCKHPKVIHDNHIDILFNGHLYFYNEKNGKIEYHELLGLFNYCDPVRQQSHQDENKQFDSINCCDKDMCKGCTNSCCLACNGFQCRQNIQPSLKIHSHGPLCGHPIIYHLGHYDYLVNDTLHRPHNGHCDNHGHLKQVELQI